MSNPLDPIMEWFLIALDSLRVTRRALNREVPDIVLPKHASFYGKPLDTSLEGLDSAEQQVADLVVLSLVATFERTVRDFLIGHPRLSPRSTDDIDARTRRQILADMEYWKMAEEVLPIFADAVDANTIGLVKQAIDYRNWVAHGRSKTRPPKSNVAPQFAYKILAGFLQEAGIL